MESQGHLNKYYCRMNYERIYESIVARGKERVTVEGYSEHHHIIPRCLGGSDDKENLVTLTAEEHYVVHQLLVKMHPGNRKLVYAVTIMSRNSNGCRSNNKMYGWLRKKFSEAQRYPHNSKTIHCLQCNLPKLVPVSYVTKFCNKTCSGLYRRSTLIVKACKICSVEFKVRKNTTNTGSFCSRSCYWASVRKS